MAQPPDTADIFVREVDENLRRDQMRDFGKKYGNWIVGAVVLFLAAAAGWIWWQNEQKKQSSQQTEELSQVYSDIAAGKTANVPQRLDAIAGSRSKAVRASALFASAAVALQQNDVKRATAKYAQIAGDGGMPRPYRDAALVRQTALEFDNLKPEQVIARLQPLAKPGSPWFGSAGELTAMALVKQGKKLEAGRLFAAIAADPEVPDTLRARSVQIAGTLGVDASGAMPLPGQ